MIGAWAKMHRVAFVIAGLSALFAVIYSLPPQAGWFPWQRLVTALGFLAHGTLIPLATLIPRLIDLPALGVALLVFLGLMAGLAVEFLWNQAWLGKAAIVIVALLNAGFGFFWVVTTDVLVGKPYADCEQMVSETNGIRIVAYPEMGFLPGGHFFFLATRDSGQSWRQIMHFRHDDLVDPPCQNIRSLGPDHYWVWMGWKFTATSDEGRSWQDLDLVETWPNWAWYHYGLITNVAFEDPFHGCMLLHPTAWRGSTPQICTEDGGKTWYVPEE